MGKGSSSYVCQQCGYSQVGWAGKCPECNSWGSLVETVPVRQISRKNSKSSAGLPRSEPLKLSDVKASSTKRTKTRITELDRVLGGGLVAGQVILIAGEPGIGKSTVLLQVADALGNLLYISGEESVGQIRIRADRLGVKKKTIRVMEETNVDNVLDSVSTLKDSKLEGVVVDSIQTMSTSDLTGMAGSVGQVRECAYRLVRLAKQLKIPIFIVGHVTKEGSVAGPAVLSHLVDTILWFEGDKNLSLRVLRAVKNRFGPTDEVGVFSMEESGLVSLSNPEKIFLSKKGKNIPGDVIASTLKGTRPMLVEIQSLVVPSKMPYPKRIAQGFDVKRLELLLAVLQQRCGIPIYDYDCFINVAGGISIKNDPSTDLGVCLSIASAFYNKPLPGKSIAIGEVGLLGDIREVVVQRKRIIEAKRLGYVNIISNNNFTFLRDAIKKILGSK